MKLTLAIAALSASILLASCTQPAGPAPAQAQAAPQRPVVVGIDFREDGRKIILVQDPEGSLRMCELRGGNEQMRWDCVPLPPL